LVTSKATHQPTQGADNMTKADRQEFDQRLAAKGHYERLAVEQCIAYGMLSKKAFLARERAKEGDKP